MLYIYKLIDMEEGPYLVELCGSTAVSHGNYDPGIVVLKRGLD